MEGLQVARGGERGGEGGGGDKGGGDTTRFDSGEETVMPPGYIMLPGLARAADTSLRIRGRGASFASDDWTERQKETDRQEGERNRERVLTSDLMQSFM